jgi:hypothetical protein
VILALGPSVVAALALSLAVATLVGWCMHANWQTLPTRVPCSMTRRSRCTMRASRSGLERALFTGGAFGTAQDAARNATNAMAAQDPSASADITAFPTVQDEHRRLIDATDELMRAATKTVGAQLP